MPAPQASQMQQLARAKFTSFALRVPTNWQDPQGDDGDMYRNAFKQEELMTQPGSPPLFMPASMNKYHTDAQKMHVAKVGSFIDGICGAICSAWSQWQSMASMAGVIVAANMANAGQLIGPPLTPFIMAEAPKETPNLIKFSTVIAAVIDLSWTMFTATVKFAATPVWPQFLTFPLPAAPPMPGTPVPFQSLIQVPASIMAPTMKMQMIANLGDPTAPFHMELFDSICTAFEACYQTWAAATMVTNVIGFGAVPSWTPVSPAGPVVGTATMAPGGLI